MAVTKKKDMPVVNRVFYVLLLLLVAYIFAVGLTGVSYVGKDNNVTLDKGEFAGSLGTTELFIRASPTYSYDGGYLEFRNATVCGQNCWVFRHTFVMMHGGYGNREGQNLTQAFGQHEVVTKTDKGQIVSAVIDGKWDELKQKLLTGTE